MKTFTYTPGRIVMGRLERGDELLSRLTALCEEQNIAGGTVAAIGAVENATVGYYDQTKRQYHQHRLDQSMEILQLTGNISSKDGGTFLHCHVTLSDDKGACWGGHLFAATVFACEFVVTELLGTVPARHLDDPTGLALW